MKKKYYFENRKDRFSQINLQNPHFENRLILILILINDEILKSCLIMDICSTLDQMKFSIIESLGLKMENLANA